MRIVHTCLRYPPATGGVETYARELVERTRNIDEGRDVRVITSLLRTHGPVSLLEPALLRDDPPYVQRVYTNATPLLSYPRLDALAYYLKHHQPNIIHGYSFWYQPADVAARYAKKQHIPFIFHPMFYETAIRQKMMWQLYKKTIGQATFAAADVVAVISPYERTLIEAAGLPVKRFELLTPGVDTERLSTKLDNPYKRREISGRVVLAVSRLSADKGIDEIIRAFARWYATNPDTSLVIIGEDFGSRLKLEQLVQQLNLTPAVQFWGSVETNLLTAAYQHADVFIHASHYEAFGIVIAEALAAGTPVVARNVAAIPFVAPHEKAGLLFNNADELYQSMATLLHQPRFAQKLAAQGQAYVTQNFNWDTTIKKLTSLYAEFGH